VNVENRCPENASDELCESKIAWVPNAKNEPGLVDIVPLEGMRTVLSELYRRPWVSRIE
jgi:hypothetical protein